MDMKNRHEINVNDLLQWMSEKGNDEVTYASQLPLKRLTCTLSGNYRVYKNGEIVYEGSQPFPAVECYNEI